MYIQGLWLSLILSALVIHFVLNEVFVGRTLYCKLGEKLVHRSNVPADKKLWHIPWPEYSPTSFTIDMKGKPWADPEIG